MVVERFDFCSISCRKLQSRSPCDIATSSRDVELRESKSRFQGNEAGN